MKTQKEITSFVRKFAKTNTKIHEAIFLAQELINSDEFKEINNLDSEEKNEILEKITIAFKKISKDTEIAEPIMCDCYFQDFERFGHELLDYMEGE